MYVRLPMHVFVFVVKLITAGYAPIGAPTMTLDDAYGMFNYACIHMDVCMYVCICVCMYVCMYVYVCINRSYDIFGL